MAICVFSNERSALFAEDCFHLSRCQYTVVRSRVEAMVPNQGGCESTLTIVSETTHSSKGTPLKSCQNVAKRTTFPNFFVERIGILLPLRCFRLHSLLNCLFKLTASKGQQGSSGGNLRTSQPKNRFSDALVRGRQVHMHFNLY